MQVLQLLNSPYFQQLLSADPTYLAGSKAVHVSFTQIRLTASPYRMDLQAASACLSYICSLDATRLYVLCSQITPDTLFRHFHAAFFFQLGNLVEELAGKIAEMLSPQTIVPALSLALETESTELVATAYQWIRKYFFGQLGLVNPEFQLDPKLVLNPPKLIYTRTGALPEEVSLDCYCNMGVDTLRKVEFYHVIPT